MIGTIFDIQRSSLVDGPGIRTTVFFKGCNLKCMWCHNPESQIFHPQILFYKNKCTGCERCLDICPHALDTFYPNTQTDSNHCTLCGKCTFVCPADARKICGKSWTVDAVCKEILKDKAFYDNSDGGVTFSGGECMLQIDFLYECLKKCKENDIHTAVDTAGNVPWSSFEKILPYTDLFLYDVKCISEERHKTYTGASNVLILENLKKLSEKFDGSIIIRVPIIPTFNDGAELEQIAKFLKSIKHTSVEVLPYHKMGEHKYQALNMPFHSYNIPDTQTMDRIRVLLKN